MYRYYSPVNRNTSDSFHQNRIHNERTTFIDDVSAMYGWCSIPLTYRFCMVGVGIKIGMFGDRISGLGSEVGTRDGAQHLYYSCVKRNYLSEPPKTASFLLGLTRV